VLVLTWLMRWTRDPEVCGTSARSVALVALTARAEGSAPDLKYVREP